MQLLESEIYNKFRYEVTRAHIDKNGKNHKANKLDGYNYNFAVKECISILFSLKDNNDFLFKEYGLLKLDTPSKPFGANKVESFFSKAFDYIYLFFEKLLTLVGSVVVSSEVIRNSSAESITKNLFVFAGIFVFIKVVHSILKWVVDDWKKQCSTTIFITTLQKPFISIIGEMMSNENIKKMKEEEFEKWALKIIFNGVRNEN